MNPAATRILTRADVAALLTMDDCLLAVEDAFRGYGEGRIAPPGSLGVPAEGGAFHIKAGVAGRFAAKVNGNFPGNPARHGLPTVQGVIVVMDGETGSLLALMDSTLITILRTAAATAVAAKHLARMDATRLAVIGCGNQGRAHVEAIQRVRAIDHVRAYDLDLEAASRFAREMTERLGIEVVASASVDDAVAAADIVVTCTPARAPILDARHLRPGLFVAGVGADNSDKHELAPALLRGSRVVVDILEQAAAMGDLHHALAAGVLTREDVHGELAGVICGRVSGRRNGDEVFVFDSTGTALQDVAVASLAYTRAAERDIGLEVAFR